MKNSKRKIDKKRLKKLESQAVSIPAFLTKVLGLRNNDLMQVELTHSDLMELFPKLERSSFDAILDDPSMVYEGKVVLVQDSMKKFVPYINKGIKTLESYGIDDVMDRDDWNQDTSTWEKREKSNGPSLQEYDLSSMAIYELKELLNIYSATHQKGNYEKVRRELVSRKDSRHNSLKSKQKALRRDNKRKIDDDE